jgi:hypothetical protein
MRKLKRPKTKAQLRLERKERKERYGKNWDIIRKKVYARDGYKCKACGASNVKLNAHHILLLRVSQTNDERNLVTLCDRCHKIVEEKAINLLKSGGHRRDVVRMTHRWLLEMNAKYRNGKLLTEEEDNGQK